MDLSAVDEIFLEVDLHSLTRSLRGRDYVRKFRESYTDELRNIPDVSDSLEPLFLVPLLTVMAEERDSMAGSDVLWVAPGAGLGMKVLEQEGYAVRGVDATEDLVCMCTNRGLNVVKGDAFDLPYLCDTFDAVVTRDLLRKDYPPMEGGIVAALREQYMVLRAGGIAVRSWSTFDMRDSPGDAFLERLYPSSLAQLPFSSMRFYTLRSNNFDHYVEVYQK